MRSIRPAARPSLRAPPRLPSFAARQRPARPVTPASGKTPTKNPHAPEGPPQLTPHVYRAIKSRKQVSIMRQTTVGLAMPSVVLLPTREIVAGMAIFRRGYVKAERRSSLLRLKRLYLHELGHVLGLGHSGSTSDVMFAEMDTIDRLGPGDKAGVAAFTQPCTRTSLPSLKAWGWIGYWPIQPEMGSEAK